MRGRVSPSPTRSRRSSGMCARQRANARSRVGWSFSTRKFATDPTTNGSGLSRNSAARSGRPGSALGNRTIFSGRVHRDRVSSVSISALIATCRSITVSPSRARTPLAERDHPALIPSNRVFCRDSSLARESSPFWRLPGASSALGGLCQW